jgi:hypothetical protein
MSISLTGQGSKPFNFGGATKKSTVVLITKKVDRGTAWISEFFGEATQSDGTVTVTGCQYNWECEPATNSKLIPATGSFGVYYITVPGGPGGSIEIDFNFSKWTSPPATPASAGVTPGSSSTEAQTEWLSKKVVLDAGAWLQVVDDAQIEDQGKLVSKFPDEINVLFSDLDSMERIGQDIIWESLKKWSGTISAVYNPLIKPGDVIKTSYSQKRIYDWMCRVRKISFSISKENRSYAKYYIKERAFEGE